MPRRSWMPWKINFRFSFTFFAQSNVPHTKKNEKFTHFSARLHDMTSYLRARESLISPRRLYFFKIQLFSWFYLFIQCATRPHHFNLITSHFWAIFVSGSKQSRRKFSARRMEKLSDSTALLGKTHHRATQHRTAQRRQSSSFVFQLCVFSSFPFAFFTRGNEKSADSRARDTRENTTRIQPNSRTIPCKLMSAEFSTRVKCFVCGTSFSLSENSRSFPLLLTLLFRESQRSCLRVWTLIRIPFIELTVRLVRTKDEGCFVCRRDIFSSFDIYWSRHQHRRNWKICYVIYKADMYPTLKNKQGMKL